MTPGQTLVRLGASRYIEQVASFGVEACDEPFERDPPAHAPRGRPSGHRARHRRLGSSVCAGGGVIPVFWLGLSPLLRALSLLSAASVLPVLPAAGLLPSGG